MLLQNVSNDLLLSYVLGQGAEWKLVRFPPALGGKEFCGRATQTRRASRNKDGLTCNPLFEVRLSGRAFPIAHKVENTRDQRTSREQKLDQQVRPEGMDQVERASLLHPMSHCVETNFGCTLVWQQ